MMKKLLFLAFALLLQDPVDAQQPAVTEDIPVAPLSAVSFNDWTNCYRLKNDTTETVIVPAIGRIAFFGPANGDNLFRLDPELAGVLPSGDPERTFLNIGGDWFWPTPQAQWIEFAGKDWPPPVVLADAPWTGRAWKGSDGGQYCLITREYGEPLHIKVSRTIKLEKDQPRLTIRQSIERVRKSAIPVSLWNISQIAGVDRVFLPAGPDSAFPEGYRVIAFQTPDSNQLARCGQGIVLNTRKDGEYKLGSDSAKGWVAAQKGDYFIIERVVNSASSHPYPDGGCRTEFYSNAGLGYTEIETLSPETPLKKGDSIENVLTVDWWKEDTGTLPPCEVADQLAERISAAR